MKKILMLFMTVMLLLVNTLVYADAGVVDKEWASTINFSSLTKDTIYRYTATSSTKLPKLVNDRNENILVYLKEKDGTYVQTIYPMKTVGTATTATATTYQANEAFNLTIKSITNAEIITKVGEANVLKISSFTNNAAITYQSQTFIYNDTTSDAVLRTTEGGTSKDVTIPKNTIYGFDSTLDTVVLNPSAAAPTPTPTPTPDPVEPDDEEEQTPGGEVGPDEEEENEETNPNTGISLSTIVIVCASIGALILLGIAENNKAIKRI